MWAKIAVALLAVVLVLLALLLLGTEETNDVHAVTGQVSQEPASPTASLPLSAGIPPGQHGDPFEDRALFQGCDIVDGVDHCAFHVNGWKYYAYREGPTPAELLDRLEAVASNAPVIIRGDLVNIYDRTAEIALREVAADPQGDPYAGIRGHIQGRWVSLDDPESEIEIFGSEIREMVSGEFVGHGFLQIAETCEGAPPDAGPVLLQTDPSDQASPPLCYALLRADGQALELAYIGRGNLLRYARPD